MAGPTFWAQRLNQSLFYNIKTSELRASPPHVLSAIIIPVAHSHLLASTIPKGNMTCVSPKVLRKGLNVI